MADGTGDLAGERRRLRIVRAGFRAAIAALVIAVVVPTAAQAARTDERLTRKFYVDKTAASVQHASQDPDLKVLVKTPQAIWLTESSAPPTTVKSIVKKHVKAAGKKKRTAVFVVYAIPGRDCGQHSAGGLASTEYKKYVKQVAAGLKKAKTMVILEPDTLALGDCSAGGDRDALLTYATKKLTKAGAWVYLDAGHSNWQPPHVMADRLKAAGVKHARGFATNVSNHRTTAAEKKYAQAIRVELKKRGITKRRYVIDTSRNGAGPDANNTWCNNLGARIGKKPKVVNKNGLDAILWIKRPGESDGWCNGGPGAGEWWAWGAKVLTS